MSRAFIYCANANAQLVAANGVINPGTIVRRYGCAFGINGDALSIEGEGYYSIDGTVTVAAAAADDLTVTLYKDGTPIPGAAATVTVETIGDIVTLPILAGIRKTCCDSGVSNITAVLSAEGTVENFALRAEKE